MIPVIASNKRRESVIRYAPLLIWTGVIFFLSSGEGSMTHTSYFVEPVLRFLFPDISGSTLEIYHGYVRKMAHLTEYAVLGLLASRAFFGSSRSLLRRSWFVFAVGLVLLIAAADEFNQSFEPSRTSSPRDVLIDLLGGIAGAMFYSIWVRRRNRLKN